MTERAVLHYDHEVVPALLAMGLDKRRLIEVIRFAEAQRALCTSNDVNGFKLITAHDKAVRGLREAFCGKAWEKDETDNQAGIRNASLKLRIICCNFDENAGKLNANPTNRVIKGQASSSKARCNRTGWLPGLPIPMPTASDFTTWVLGFYAEDNEPLAGELSLPLGFSAGRYYEFVRRIVLLSGEEGGRGAIVKPDERGPVEEVDIAIKRR